MRCGQGLAQPRQMWQARIALACRPCEARLRLIVCHRGGELAWGLRRRELGGGDLDETLEAGVCFEDFGLGSGADVDSYRAVDEDAAGVEGRVLHGTLLQL